MTPMRVVAAARELYGAGRALPNTADRAGSCCASTSVGPWLLSVPLVREVKCVPVLARDSL